MESSGISVQLPMSLESTQAAMNRVMQQLNSQGFFNITESTDDNPYNFTNLHHNTISINNKEKLDNVVQETPCVLFLILRKLLDKKAWTLIKALLYLRHKELYRDLYIFVIDVLFIYICNRCMLYYLYG